MRDEFPGLNRAECCVDCTPERCVISGIGVCAHPAKGGLQSALMGNTEVMTRYQRARKQLAHQQVDGTDAQREPSPARVHGDEPDSSRPKKAARKRQKTRPRQRREGVRGGGPGPENREAGEARQEESVT